MTEPRFSVRSAKARDLAHRLARREKRPIADIVERALEAYEVRQAGRGPAPDLLIGLTDEAVLAYGDITGERSRPGSVFFALGA